MFNKNLFRAAIAKEGTTAKQVAKEMGVSEPTLYRKMAGISDFTRKEIVDIKNILHLSSDEADAIFFHN